MHNRPVIAARLILGAALLSAVSCSDRQLPTDAAAGEPSFGASPKPVVIWSEHSAGVGTLLEAVWGTDPGNVFAVGRSGMIVHYDGTVWSQQTSGSTNGFYGIWGSGRTDVWAVGGLGTVAWYDGQQWHTPPQLRDAGGGRRQLNAVWGSSGADVWTVGNAGHAWHFDGSSWTHFKLPTNVDMRGVWGTGPDNVMAVGDGGTIVRFDGESWSAMNSGTSTRLNAIWGRSDSDVVAGGSSGVIVRFDGSSWTADPQSGTVSPHHIREIWGNDARDIFAVAWGGTILHHDGRSWSRMNSATGVHLEGIWGSAGTTLFAVGYYGTVAHGSRGYGSMHTPAVQHPRRPVMPEAIWPISATFAPDADSVHAPYGPRWIGRYDFHAGVDLPAPRGTPVHAVMAGTVSDIVVWNGTSSGAGNAVTVVHSGNRATTYMHLHDVHVQVGDRLEQGQVLGTVGSTGATYPHLHLGYYVDLPAASTDERRSRNPLEILPHGTPESIDVTFAGASLELSVPLRRMTIRSVELIGAEGERFVDYYDVVARGSTARDEQVQFGVHFEVAGPDGGRFRLNLAPAPADFVPRRLVVMGIFGDTLVDARNDPDS